jgi:hypothetical protein
MQQLIYQQGHLGHIVEDQQIQEQEQRLAGFQRDLVQAHKNVKEQEPRFVEPQNEMQQKDEELAEAQNKIRELEQVIADQRKQHKKKKKKLTTELQREREAREASEGNLQQIQQELQLLQQELQHERNARELAHDRLSEVEQELVRERSAREQAEEDGRPHSGGGSAGLGAACISTASRLELEAATQEFSPVHILGRGAFGAVYSGAWRGREAAIKVLSEASRQGAKEFLREVNILGKYQHPNLVPLLGFCISKEDTRLFCALIYPRMKSSLQDALARSRNPKRADCDVLTAAARLAIAHDAARGLAYLHSPDNRTVIMHMDIKSSNILVDSDNRARIADVGLAQRLEAGASQAAGVGTLEYMDKAYMDTGKYTPGSDVFSFGVVLLELLTGQAAIDSRKDPPMLHARVSSSISQAAGAASMAVFADPVAGWALPVVEQFGSLAMDCANYTVSKRPSSQEVVERLSSMTVHQPQDAESIKECLMCMDSTRRTRLRPCCHVLFCEGCAEHAQRAGLKCPMCSAHVQEYEVGDFSATYVPA